jgi:hypothetical protein
MNQARVAAIEDRKGKTPARRQRTAEWLSIAVRLEHAKSVLFGNVRHRMGDHGVELDAFCTLRVGCGGSVG